MLGLKSPAQQTQRITGLQVSTSAMGQVVPYAFGHARIPHKLIFFSNFQVHQQDNGGKGKAGKTNWFSVNGDFILGYGPMEGYASAWENQTWYYVKYSSQTFTGAGTASSFSFTISNNTKPVVLIMGVAYQVAYSINYSDYVTPDLTRAFSLSGTSFQPLYNGLFPLPNYGSPIGASIPYAFYNAGINDPVITVFFPAAVTNPVIKVYYAQVGGSNELPGAQSGKKGGGAIPIQKGGLVFERTLGLGNTGNPLFYPEFSGDGSANIALGTSATLPSYNYEVKALFGMGNSAPISSFAAGISPGDPHQYVAGTSSGDCCPADIIADLVCSGNLVIAGTTPVIWNHGLGFTSFVGQTSPLYYSRFGGILKDEPLTFGSGSGGSGGNVTTTYYRPSSATQQLSHPYTNPSNAWDNNPTTFSQAVNIEGDPNGERWAGFPAGTTGTQAFLNVISQASMHATGAVSVRYSLNGGGSWSDIYTAQAPSNQGADRAYTQDQIHLPSGINITQIQVQAECHAGPDNGSATHWIYEIFVSDITITGGGGGGNGTLGLINLRNYCMAYGIFISGAFDSQSSAASMLDELCKVANCAPVFDGAALDFVPYCEQSFYGNGTSYVPPTASGPVFAFTYKDFLPQKDKAPVVLTYDRANPNYNSLQVGFKDAKAQFNDNFVILGDSMDVTVQGAVNSGQENFPYITNSQTAQAVGYALLHRTLIVSRKEYAFSLSGCWASILTPMMLVTILEPTINSEPIPVRIKTIGIDKNFTVQITAEPFVYGGSAPLAPPDLGGIVDIQGPPNGELDPGSVNAPVIFEAVPRISQTPEVWLSVSGVGTNWGGAVVWLSTDGGLTYNQMGTVVNREPQGLVYNSNYPSHIDPDTVNTLQVDMTESIGSLTSVTGTQQNLFFPSLCYLEGGGTIVVNNVTLTIPYELVAFQTATLTAANKYDLTQPIRRGVFNTPVAVHNIGSKFAFLGTGGNVFRLPLLSTYIGVALNFKLTSFNLTGGGVEDLGSVTAYPFTPTGQVGFASGSGGYTISPQPSVYQGKSGGWPAGTGGDSNSTTWTDPTKVYFPQITAHFSSGDITYLQRDAGLAVFTVSGGGETAYVSIFDNAQVGEGGGNPGLTAYADINPATHYNMAGYTQIGTVVSQPLSGGGGSGGGNTNANDFYIYVPIVAGTYLANQEIFYTVPVRSFTLAQGLAGSHAGCRTAPTGSITVTIKQGASTIGTINIASGQTTATFTFSTAITFNGVTDDITFIAPSSPDATFAGFWAALLGARN